MSDEDDEWGDEIIGLHNDIIMLLSGKPTAHGVGAVALVLASLFLYVHEDWDEEAQQVMHQLMDDMIELAKDHPKQFKDLDAMPELFTSGLFGGGEKGEA